MSSQSLQLAYKYLRFLASWFWTSYKHAHGCIQSYALSFGAGGLNCFKQKVSIVIKAQGLLSSFACIDCY